ncbi:MAG: VOC family protein [Ilumatobacteraceae bacterium]
MTSTPAAFADLCLDAADVRRVGSFWVAVLGGELVVRDDGHIGPGTDGTSRWLPFTS